MVDLGVPCASLLAFPSFLASAFGVRNFLTTIVTETFGDVSITKAIQKWLSLTNEQKVISVEHRKTRPKLSMLKPSKM